MILTLLTLLIVTVQTASVSSVNFTWWAGTRSLAAVSSSPRKGVYLTGNKVGTRYHARIFYDELLDSLFIFGGDTYTGSGFNIRNDLWKCDFKLPSDSQWAWIHGSDQFRSPGVYKTLGEASNETYPGARADPSHFFDAASRKFYLLHGYGLTTTLTDGVINDVWCYDVVKNTFTWLDGSTDLNSYPSLQLGVQSPIAAMGGVFGSSSTYDTASKTFYMFGGNTIAGHSNVLWKLNVDSLTVIPLIGGFNQAPSVVDVSFQFSEGNFPGARRLAESIKTNDGKLVFYGGEGYARNVSDNSVLWSYICEIWIFDLALNQWAFAGGSLFGNSEGVYSAYSNSSYPKCRHSPLMLLDSANNNIYLHGGVGIIGSDRSARLGDRWVFDLSNWTWNYLSGTSSYGGVPIYGKMRVYASSNTPGSRGISGVYQYGSKAFIFGGNDSPDVWKAELKEIVEQHGTTSTLVEAVTSIEQNTYFPISASKYSDQKGSSSSSQAAPNTIIVISVLVPVILVLAVISLLIWRKQILENETLKKPSTSASQTSDKYASSDKKRSLLMVQMTKTRSSEDSTDHMKRTSLMITHHLGYDTSDANDSTKFGTVTSLTATAATVAQESLSIPAYLEVQESSYRIVKKLKQGGGGEIYLAEALFGQATMFGSSIVVKRLKDEGQGQAEKMIKLFEQELSIMALLRNCDNVAKVIGFSRGENYSILMKYYQFGSLDTFLRIKTNTVSKFVAWSFVHDIALGLQAMHARDLAHSDIKTANILIDSDSDGYARCYLTDFGITQILSMSLVVNGFNVANVKGLSYTYCAPEAFLRYKKKGGMTDMPIVYKAGDVFSFACVIYELLVRSPPWSRKEQ
jgi:hypothetical protein